jgi:hypothetical protein
MKLTDRALEKLAEMVVGDHPQFLYRSSHYITRFFRRCGLPFVHDGAIPSLSCVGPPHAPPPFDHQGHRRDGRPP